MTARFRSGSTLLWNIFRHVEQCTAYYEPLNERRWFDPRRRGDHTDRTHEGVTDYWKEYEGLSDLNELYQERWIDTNLYMSAGAWDPNLKRYIERLAEHAPGRPVLQFNRVDFRLPWLRHHFPHARIVHLVRHPRDQWCSSLRDPSCFPKDATLADFGPHDKFYLTMWCRDLRYVFPFLDVPATTTRTSLFYFLWKLSYLFGQQYADFTIHFENLIAEPESTIGCVLERLALRDDPQRLAKLVRGGRCDQWRRYADASWFAEPGVALRGRLLRIPWEPTPAERASRRSPDIARHEPDPADSRKRCPLECVPSDARILLLTQRVPHPPDRGDRIRAFHVLQFLAERSRVYLGALSDEPVPAASREALASLCERDVLGAAAAQPAELAGHLFAGRGTDGNGGLLSFSAIAPRRQ